MTKRSLDRLGWIGVAVILAAYSANVFSLIDSTSVIYLTANLLGSVLIIFEAARKKDYQPVFLNIVWALVAFVNLLRILIL